MNGAILINKEPNMTSRDVVNRLNQILEEKSIGHTGTLDPMATGLLICLIGKCVKLSTKLTHETKDYIVEFKLGLQTDTLDIEGKILKEDNPQIKLEQLQEVLKGFIGTYNQEVPIYSAVKVNGKKLYEYARNNEQVELPKRDVTIYNIELLDFNNNKVKLNVKVSKGTYIRSLIRDISKKLGTYGTMTYLKRTKIGSYKLEDAYTLDEVLHNKYHLITLEELLKPTIINIKSKNDYLHIKNGNIMKHNINEYVLYKYNNENIALYEPFKENEIKPLIMF